MREVTFLKQNRQRWEQFEKLLNSRHRTDPDQLAELLVQLTDDLSYARTYYPKTKTTLYLNNLAGKVYQEIYKNRRERSNRFVTFWTTELPELMWQRRRELLYSFLLFSLFCLIGAFSAAIDPNFVRVILGDSYVNMTLENIENGDPLAVYKQQGEGSMFARITVNNIFVSLVTFIKGVVFSLGTVEALMHNGIMLGSFQYFFYERGFLVESLLTIWIHGTLEISAIVIAGAAGLTMGNSILFPGTYTRLYSFMRGAKQGLKMVIGLVPVFIMAGFLESFVTRHNDMHPALSLAIILGSATFVVWYFLLYPSRLHQQRQHDTTGTA